MQHMLEFVSQHRIVSCLSRGQIPDIHDKHRLLIAAQHGRAGILIGAGIVPRRPGDAGVKYQQMWSPTGEDACRVTKGSVYGRVAALLKNGGRSLQRLLGHSRAFLYPHLEVRRRQAERSRNLAHS